MRVGVAGVGRIGLPLSLVYAKAGNDVVAVDINPQRIADINNGIEFAEPSVNEYLKLYKKRLAFTTDNSALKDCDVVTIMVNTPSLPDGSFDVSSIEKIVKEIKEINSNALISISSNVNIGTCDKLRKIYKHIACCPEFIAQGSVIRDFENPKFAVLGAYSLTDTQKLTCLWKGIHNKPIYIVKPVEAEIIKLCLNVSYCIGITWANLVGQLSLKLSADSNKILDIIHKDWRNYKSGLGFGGPCFPRDVKCFKRTCEKLSLRSGVHFSNTLDSLNLETELYYYTRILKLLGRRGRVGVLGVAYKPGVPYVWGSQALSIATKFVNNGHQVYIYDPLAEAEAKKVVNSVVFCKTLDSCLKNSDVLFIGTSEYRNVVAGKLIVNPWRD